MASAEDSKELCVANLKFDVDSNSGSNDFNSAVDGNVASTSGESTIFHSANLCSDESIVNPSSSSNFSSMCIENGFMPAANFSYVFASKRKHNTLSLETKLEIIQRLENGESSSHLAKLYDIGRATMFDLKKKKSEILSFASKLNSEDALKQRKTMRMKVKQDNVKPNSPNETDESNNSEQHSILPEVKQEAPETSSCSNTKRKHNVLSLETKMEIIERLEQGESISSLAPIYNVGRATVFDIKSKKESILQFASQLKSGEDLKKRKTMRKANDEPLEETLYLWYLQRVSQGQTVTGPLLSEKALELNCKLGGPLDFKASSGWLKNFRTRYNVQLFYAERQPPVEDKPTVDNSFLEAYLNLLQQEGYSRDDIYTADKIEINLKSMPRKSFMFQHESEDTKKCLENITIMTCANSSWNHALPLLIIGKSKKEKCFKKISCLPVIYRSQKDGMVDPEIFLDWYSNEFISAVKKERNNSGKSGKVLLLLHNANFLPNVDALNVIDENFQVMYFPSYVKSLVHSMDQAVLKKLKTMFKMQVINRLLVTADNVENMLDFSKRLTLKDFSYMLADTWGTLSEEKMKEEWKKLWGLANESEKTESQSSEKELKEISEMCKSIPSLSKCDREDIKVWLSNDNDGFKEEIQEVDTEEAEIITPLPMEECFPDDSDDNFDVDSTELPDNVATSLEAMTAFETAIEWYEQQKECSSEQLIFLKRLKDLAAKKSLPSSLYDAFKCEKYM